LAQQTDSLSIIDTGLTITGEIQCTGQLIIKGTVKGTITAESVVIAKEGNVFAKSQLETIVIGGNYEGELSASGVLKILSTGKCSGKVICKDIVVENGSTLNASVDCSVIDE